MQRSQLNSDHTADTLGGLVMLELNRLTYALRESRIDALEAEGLLSKVMAEIDVAVFAFDLRWLMIPAGILLVILAAVLIVTPRQARSIRRRTATAPARRSRRRALSTSSSAAPRRQGQ
mgnify:CR=1 FL=1